MNSYHRKAIELKYNGQTYKEIEKSLGGKISEGVLKKLFATDGTLYIPYLQFEGEMNQWAQENTKKDYQRMAAYTAKIQRTILQKALKQGDLRLAFDILKDINDRAGLVIVRKRETEKSEESRRILTDEEYKQKLVELDMDPITGLNLSYIKRLSPEERDEIIEEMKGRWWTELIKN